MDVGGKLAPLLTWTKIICWACGHPLLQYGMVDMPMTKGERSRHPWLRR